MLTHVSIAIAQLLACICPGAQDVVINGCVAMVARRRSLPTQLSILEEQDSSTTTMTTTTKQDRQSVLQVPRALSSTYQNATQ